MRAANKGAGMQVRTVLEAKAAVATVKPDLAMSDLASRLIEHRIGALAVVDAGGGMIGVISERDVVRGLADHGAALADLAVRDLMTADVVACKPEDSLADIREMMALGRFRHMPVVEEGELVGMISVRDIVSHMVDEKED